MDDNRQPTEGSETITEPAVIPGPPVTTAPGLGSMSQPSSISQAGSTGIREDISVDSNDSGPLVGFSSNKEPLYPPFNPRLISHMGTQNLTSGSSTQNSEATHREGEEEFTKGLQEFNTKLQSDEAKKVTKLAKTWMSHLRRITNIKKDFDTTKTESNSAYNKIITDSATNEGTKYLIDIVEEEISEAEQAKSKTS